MVTLATSRFSYFLPPSKITLFWFIFVFTLTSGCSSSGGSSASGGGGVTPVPGGTAAIIEPATGSGQALVVVSGVSSARTTITLHASVTSDDGAGVDWFVNGQLGGSNTLGTITSHSAADAFATYSAPSSQPSAPPNNFVTITAQQPGKNGGAIGPMSDPGFIAIILLSSNALPTGGGSVSFVFRLRGFSRTGPGLPFGIIGRFTLDGIGSPDESAGITAGVEDVNIAQPDGSSAAFTEVAFTGGYNMDTSSHGTMKLTVTNPPWAGSAIANPPPSTMTFLFTLTQDGSATDLIEAEPDGSYAGTAEFQAQNATTHGTESLDLLLEGTGGIGASAVHNALVGRLDLLKLTSSTGIIVHTSTVDDQSGNGGAAQTISGQYKIHDTVNGHGELDVTAGTSTLILTYYIVTPKKLFVLETDANPAGSNKAIFEGALVEVSGTPNGPLQFDNTAFNGSHIIILQGITDSTATSGQGHGSAVLGEFSGSPGAPGAGTLSGLLDVNDGGLVPADTALLMQGAAFTIDARGRGFMQIPLTVSGNAVTYNFVFYANSLHGGVMVEQQASDGSNRGRSGIWLTQDGSPPFVASGSNGIYVATTATRTPTAFSVNSQTVFTLNGGSSGNSGSFTGNEDESVAGSAYLTAAASGTFTVTDQSKGRGTINASSGSIIGSGNAAFYVLNASEIITMGIDNTNTEPQTMFLTQ